MKLGNTSVALQLCPAWQICLKRFDQLYVSLFLPMKLRCDSVFLDYCTWGREAVCHVMSSIELDNGEFII